MGRPVPRCGTPGALPNRTAPHQRGAPRAAGTMSASRPPRQRALSWARDRCRSWRRRRVPMPSLSIAPFTTEWPRSPTTLPIGPAPRVRFRNLIWKPMVSFTHRTTLPCSSRCSRSQARVHPTAGRGRSRPHRQQRDPLLTQEWAVNRRPEFVDELGGNPCQPEMRSPPIDHPRHRCGLRPRGLGVQPVVAGHRQRVVQAGLGASRAHAPTRHGLMAQIGQCATCRRPVRAPWGDRVARSAHGSFRERRCCRSG